jgi:hypothetical protein
MHARQFASDRGDQEERRRADNREPADALVD